MAGVEKLLLGLVGVILLVIFSRAGGAKERKRMGEQGRDRRGRFTEKTEE